MRDIIFLSGATGFLGTEIAAELIRRGVEKLYVLVRADSPREAVHRLKGAWYHDRELFEAIGQQIIPFPGDFTSPDLKLSEETQRELLESVTLVIHAGAEVGFQKSRAELENTNTDGTGNMIAFARRMGSLRRFVYISTAYVSGQKTGRIMEDEPGGTSFSGFYEESKARAEALVRGSGLPYAVCRPGMIVGNSQNGRAKTFNTVYYLLKRMLLKELKVLPADPENRLNIVPVDYVAESVLTIAFSQEAEGKTFHLTCPDSMAPSAEELAQHVKDWAQRELKITLPSPVFLPVPGLRQAGLHHNAREEEKRKDGLSNMLTLAPYFCSRQVYDRTNTDEICGEYTLRWQDYIDTLLAFACSKNFMSQTGRNVFEQARVRRESVRHPIFYYDITEAGIRRVSGPEANRRIDRIVRALRSWGIKKGDRVALTGINSVAYMTLEQAIGLIGAVSVPIYYTTPAAEASLLLSKSGAKWFFVGDKRMLEQISEIRTSARIVVFSAALEVFKSSQSGDGTTDGRKKILRWGRFLKKADLPGTSSAESGEDYPEPDDLATIRYTSGTTGEPKGVMFNYGQLAWMGEVLTNLLSWEDRNRTMRYLSFLPLSHVVEGILASYAPYYVLARVDYYYLNDFGKLTDSLPKVRPTVFFSVPRFYEKLWDQVSANRVGKAYLSAKEGPVKQALGTVLKSAVLKKAGLSDCGQLIVGSAPVSEALLLKFRELGIEIYNAYGQTEAPLITINRTGDNEIPSIGTPLPETHVSAESDGELIVTGPQVALGYYGLETDTIRDGVLRTGDLGVIHENGHITLIGRKKDMIVTAYGKNISIPKIEERLKNIPGVSEAVLIGENRPFCTALLWLEGGVAGLDRRIEEMNAGLSHPEQIRTYRVISRPLSIREEELTPNLKVKRANVEAHFAKEIEEMYRQ